MILYWIGDLLLVAVLPIVIYLLGGILKTSQEIASSVARVADAASAGSKDLDAVPLLLTTQSQVRQTVETVADFGGSLDVIIDDA